MFHLRYRVSNQPTDTPDSNFDTLEEMLEDPRVKLYWHKDANFYQFSETDHQVLLAEYMGGKIRYVVGTFLSGDTPPWLPKWQDSHKGIL